MDPARGKRIAQRLLALALGLALAPFAAELGYRGWRAARAETWDSAAERSRFDAELERVLGLQFVPAAPGDERDRRNISLHPYLGFQIQGFWKQRDNLGAYWRSAEAESNFDVLLLGGSVAAGFGNCAELDLFPLLAADPRLAGRKLVLHARCCPAHKQPQHALNLQWALSLGDRPDLVLLIDGFNELAVAAHNAETGVHPLFPTWAQMQASLTTPLADPEEFALVGDIELARREAEHLGERARTQRLFASAILGARTQLELSRIAARCDALFARLEALEAANRSERPLFIAGPPFDADPERARAVSIEAWVQGSRTMHAACRARGIPFVHVLQPAARDTGSKPLTPEEDEHSREPAVWRVAVEQGYPLLREAGAQLAREGVAFVDATRVFAEHPEEIYKDPCHFERDGHMLLSSLIAPHVLSALPDR